MPPLFGEFRPVETGWVQYKVHETDSDTQMEITIAVIAREKCQLPEPAAAKKEDAAPAEDAATEKADKPGKKGKKDKAKAAPKPAPAAPKKDCYWVEIVTQLIDGPSAAVRVRTTAPTSLVPMLIFDPPVPCGICVPVSGKASPSIIPG